MRIDLIVVGRLKAGPEQDLCARYAERFAALGRGLGLDGPRIVEIGESRARLPEARKAEEARLVAAAIEDGAVVIALDERGSAVSTAQLRDIVRGERDAGRRALAILIGGADGLDPDLTAKAQRRIAFGAMTLPHQLVRVLALEQLYRVATLLAGHPYHRV
jgi:23S rRNA (pseudouridine1915-N3)-methyltransferase